MFSERERAKGRRNKKERKDRKQTKKLQQNYLHKEIIQKKTTFVAYLRLIYLL